MSFSEDYGKLKPSKGSVVGSYIPINRGDSIVSITASLPRTSRHVTGVYWIDDDNFSVPMLDIKTANFCTSINSTDKNVKQYEFMNVDFSDSDNTFIKDTVIYIDTTQIGSNSTSIQFNFEPKIINSDKIFFAFLSTPGNGKLEEFDNFTTSTFQADYIWINQYGTKFDTSKAIRGLSIRHAAPYLLHGEDMRDGLFIGRDAKLNITKINDGTIDVITPSKIKCSNISYRTWSCPDKDQSFTIKADANDKFNLAWADGGENKDDVDVEEIIPGYKTHIINENDSDNDTGTFIDDYYIPEGRLKDVTFASPELEAYIDGNNNKLPRWVFKRSRIKFTIPPIKNTSGLIVNKVVKISYKISTPISELNSKFIKKTHEYSLEESKKDINIVICPRDEGILDNMPFTITFSRSFINGSESEESNYQFHTYQNPNVDIAYPNIIRSKVTETNKDFRFSKILTSNLYADFKGENSIVSKYVCDSLNVMFATPKNDASGIPMFVRFYLAEYKYGRNGLLNETHTDAEWNDDFDNDKIDTLQSLYRSNNSADYTTLDEILNDANATNKKTAYMTNICNNDDSGILLSGRLSDKTLKDIGESHNLWTYNTWDDVIDDHDVKVKNAYPYEYYEHDLAGNRIKDENGKDKKTSTLKNHNIVGDHKGCKYSGFENRYPNGDINGDELVPITNTSILFRAGYIYLLKARMFHGAAAGAIGKIYSYKNSIIYGKPGTGNYDYSGDSIYTGNYPEKDNSEHGNSKPYNGWIGPSDGTENISLTKVNKHKDKINQTYNGFSIVDYTIIEPVCPYTSRSNVITTHPSSPEIGANQWLSFNYRHLSKNLAGIDDRNKYGNINNVFSKKISGVQNTISRIMSMYTSCTEYIINKYMNKADKNTILDPNNKGIKKEEISIWIDNINNHTNQTTDNCEYVESRASSGNSFLISNFDIKNKTYHNIIENDNLYDVNSGLRSFKKYRTSTSDTYDYKDDNPDKWRESSIVWKHYVGTSNINNDTSMSEPLGNVYRWQVVINATKSPSNDIQIENKRNDAAKSYPITDVLLQKEKPDLTLIYTNTSKYNDYDLQTKYYYEDTFNYDSNSDIRDFSNNNTNRFCINEFAGETNGEYQNPGKPVMYTTPSINENQSTFKFFALKPLDNSLNNSSYEKLYGNLYSRIASWQDCENGDATVAESSIENLNITGAYDINKEYSINNNSVDNILPIIRTTHYLYFKTYINTAFYMKINVTYNDDTIKTFFFNGNNIIDATSEDPNNLIKFGNSDGISEVYAEDNYGWGRCLTAEDCSSRKLIKDSDNNKIAVGDVNSSGGIEVPIFVRRTPLLQPILESESYYDANNEKLVENSIPISKSITLLNNKTIKQIEFLDNDENKNNVRTDLINLNVYYPFIPECNEYHTKSPNGGLDGIVYDNYYYDKDSFSKDLSEMSVDESEFNNKDFMGGYGICTAYTAILVPNDLKLSDYFQDKELNTYFKNINESKTGRLSYFKQISNYYKKSDIYQLRSASVTNAGPVLIAYNYQYNNSNLNYNKDPDSNLNGRNYQSIPLNIKYLKPNTFEDYKVYYEDQPNPVKANTLNLGLSSDNQLRSGVIYDLVIIPVYSDIKTSTYKYINGKGMLNGETYGGTTTDNNIHYAGSNPLILNNYLSITNEVNPGSGEGGGIVPDPPVPEHDGDLDYSKIWNNDSLIVFPNVDNVKYNCTSGKIKECPGFWLNNSFRLILRMPSFRTNETRFSSGDTNTVENMSNGAITDVNDFLFEDIQIHIGKITELSEYGWPNSEALNLNKLTTKEELARVNIISYKHYKNDDVFSKKLNNDDVNDKRELLTAGSLDPLGEHAEDYSNRFIEVNLSNAKIFDESQQKLVSIYTKYPEGYYIQFRWKTAYASGSSNSQWSSWYGGSYDGGKHWWGDKGLNYYVPIRNYSQIHTDFRNYIKESYPGSIYKLGKGSLMENGDIDMNSLTNPKSSKPNSKYYIKGVGNLQSSKDDVSTTTMIVPSITTLNVVDTLDKEMYGSIKISDNNDNCYIPQYINSHDKDFNIPENITNMHQHEWETLYVDYIIRNMYKLYYKPDHNYDETDKFSPSETPYTNNYIYYHSSTPYDNNEAIQLYWTDKYKEVEYNALEKQWSGNKYYRKLIKKDDFKILNNKLIELTSFIRHSKLSGKNVDNEFIRYLGTYYVLPINESELLDYELSSNNFKNGIIGHTTSSDFGVGNINNLNKFMVSHNYVQTLWTNILQIIDPGNKSNEYDIYIKF